MKNCIREHFDKLMMFSTFLILLTAYLIFMTDTLSTLCRDAFLVLTALLGFRRYGNAPVINAETIETGEISPTEKKNLDEKPLTYIG